MPFREKTAWISLLATLAVYGGYFASLNLPGSNERQLASSFGLLVGATVLFIVVMVVLTAAAAMLAPRDAAAPRDEREKLISLKAVRVAYFAVASGSVTAMGALLLGFESFLVANVLFLSLVLAELFKDAAQIFYFRRGS